jgi:hypothetical protein
MDIESWQGPKTKMAYMRSLWQLSLFGTDNLVFLAPIMGSTKGYSAVE